jgi:small subunit ribosomal protein S20
MPIKHAALKQLRKDKKRQQRNQAVRSEIKTLTKRLLSLLKGQQFEAAETLLREVASKFDRAAAKHVIHPNTAARYKSRLTLRVRKRSG